MSIRQAGRWLGLASMLLGIGCVPGHLTINVHAAANVNQARPVRMVVRTVDSKAYLGQTYNEVVAKLIVPDASVIYRGIVFPGGTQPVTVKVPQSLPVAVSFLFTTPDGTWQTLLDALVPGTVDIQLEGSRIQQGGSTTSEVPPQEPPSAGSPAPEK